MLKKIQYEKSAYDRYFKEADDQEDNVSVTVAPRKNRGTDYSQMSETDDITVAPRSNRGTDYAADDEPDDTTDDMDDIDIDDPDLGDDESSYTDDELDDIELSDEDMANMAMDDGPDFGGDDGADYSDDAEVDAADDGDTGEDGDATNGPDTGDDSTDYTADGESQGEDGDMPEEEPMTEEEKREGAKKYNVYKRFLHLYNVLDSFSEKLRNVVTDSSIDNAVIKVVVNNFNNIHDMLYDYMTIKFKSESYVQVLVYFETVVSLVRLNFELLRNNHVNLKQ